jgi:hypothetical protein
MQPHSPILIQLYNAILEDMRFHRNQLYRLEQRAYTIEGEILAHLLRRRSATTGEATTTSSSSSATNPSTTSPEPIPSATPILRNLSRSHSHSPVFTFEGEEERPPPYQERSRTRNLSPLLHEPTLQGSEATETNPPSLSSAFSFLGTFDLPLAQGSVNTSTREQEVGSGGGGGGGGGEGARDAPFLPTSFAQSLLNRRFSSVPPAASSLSDSSAFLLYFMLDNMNQEPNGEEQRGIQDVSRYVTDRLFEEIANPPNTCCPIRMDVFTSQSEVSQINKCKHIFCRQEIRRWLQTNHTCPLCRTTIDVE